MESYCISSFLFDLLQIRFSWDKNTVLDTEEHENQQECVDAIREYCDLNQFFLQFFW